MTRKDRIAIVLTIPFLILSLLILIDQSSSMVQEFAISIAPVIVYWGYRFIKGDISFMKQKEI